MRFRDLQSCGGHLVVLTDDGVHVGLDGAAPACAGPLPAAQLACPRAGPGPWLAAGDGLLESLDQGRTFRSRADAPAGAILAAALTGDRIWVVPRSAGITTLPWQGSGCGAPCITDAGVDEDIVAGSTGRPRWAAFAAAAADRGGQLRQRRAPAPGLPRARPRGVAAREG